LDGVPEDRLKGLEIAVDVSEDGVLHSLRALPWGAVPWGKAQLTTDGRFRNPAVEKGLFPVKLQSPMHALCSMANLSHRFCGGPPS
jgi:hypothetical protein